MTAGFQNIQKTVLLGEPIAHPDFLVTQPKRHGTTLLRFGHTEHSPGGAGDDFAASEASGSGRSRQADS